LKARAQQSGGKIRESHKGEENFLVYKKQFHGKKEGGATEGREKEKDRG